MKGFTTNLNILEIEELPEVINRLKIHTPLRCDELNTILGPISDLQYHYHENILYYLGDSERLKDTLDSSSIEYEELTPLEVDVVRDFPLLRILIYKALRRSFTRLGFTWDFRKGRKNVVFLTNPDPKIRKDVKSKFGIDLIHTLVGNLSDLVITVHEGFRYKVEILRDSPILVVRRRVTPLVQANLSHLGSMSSIVCVCRVKCPSKTACRKLPRRKIIVGSYDAIDETYDVCPEGDKRLVRIIDKRGIVYEVPAHTIHIEASSALMSRVGVYKSFRSIAIKQSRDWSKIMHAILYYLSGGSDEIRINMGDAALVIDSTPVEVSVEVDRDVWDKYKVAD